MSAAVLVVEDNVTTRKMMRQALQSEGYLVLEAEDGATALRLAGDHRPGLVLMDCKLPDMDGFEVVRRLHEIAPELPVVAVTGWAQDEARMHSAGFVEVLLKPIDLSRLFEVVSAIVGPSPTEAGLSGKILLADDDPAQRKLGRLALMAAGFEVLLAEDGDVAVRMAKEHKPDAIVSDILMPGRDGFAVCEAIRSDPSVAGTPIVLVSAHYVEEEDRALASRFGANVYVSRTEGFDAVIRAVADAMKAPAQWPSAAPTYDRQSEYLRRVASQLERQAAIGAGLARRVSVQASSLSVLDRLSDSLTRQLDPENALGETLAECLDHAGLSVGAILLFGTGGELTLKAQLGSGADLKWDTYGEIFRDAVRREGLIIPSSEAGPQADALIARLGAASALVVPIVARDEALGVLLLGSNAADLAGDEGESFVRAARSVSRQLGQALALNRMFSKLAMAEHRYRTMMEHARDGIGVLTEEGVILEVNRGWEEMMGIPRSQMIGRNLTAFAVDAEHAASLAAFDKPGALAGGTLPPTPMRRPDGTVVQVELSRTVVDVGSERYVLGVGRDVTDRLRLEDQLRHAQKMEAVGRLAGGVAHDFNNVLSVILSYGELLLGALKPDDPMREDVEEIRKAGRRAADLTRQLLMFSRQQVLEPKVLDLNEVLAGMEKMVQRLLGEDVELVSLFDKNLGRVRADPGSIEQIIMNLLVNARDAMPTGGRLTIQTANVVLDDAYARAHIGAKPGPHVLLAVTDSGVGMDRATQARIFEPFFTTKERSKGTGLGLSTVFGIVEQSGGHVWVDSDVGKGASFRVYLPRVSAEAGVERDSPAPATMRGTESILLVEDDDQVRTVARSILEKHGYTVTAARHAGEAILISEQRPGAIDLLLTDVVMPQMSGPRLAQRLAAARPEMKVLFMSGYTDDSIVRHGVHDAKIAYLQKPITPDALTRKVREVLDGVEGGGKKTRRGDKRK